MTTPTTSTTPSAHARDELVDAGELRFHYREWGEPADPEVLLLHGLTGNSWEWDPIAAALSTRFHVVALDQRGHGASAWAGDYAAERMVQDLARIAAALELDHPAIVGHSMGGINGILLAARHPELVERLAIVEIGPDSLPPAAVAGWGESLRASAQATYSDPAEAFAEWQHADPHARRRELQHFVVHNLVQDGYGLWRWRFDAAGLESFLEQVPDEGTLWAALRQVTCPALVIRGQHSEALRAGTAARMTRKLSASRFVEIPDGGHDLTVEQPDALTRALERFLEPARQA